MDGKLIKGTSRRYVVVFMSVLVCSLALIVWATSRIPNYRNDPIDFYAIGADDRVLLTGLTREQVGSLKISFSERLSPPDIGIFGNHQIQYWAADSFDIVDSELRVFNYQYANLALPDLLDYLLHLERLDKLPTRLIVLHITTPNNDNGAYVIERSRELPADIQFAAPSADSGWLDRQQFWASATRAILWVDKTFDYATVLTGVFHSKAQDRILSLKACSGQRQRQWVDRLPAMLVRLIGAVTGRAVGCDPAQYRNALMADGSLDATDLRRSPIIDANPLDPNKAHLVLGDEQKIAQLMRAIDAVGKRAGVPVIFLIPPVYESERYSTVDRVFDMALDLAPDLSVIDHRHRHIEQRNFINYDHPAPSYFQFVVSEITARALHSSD
ncbi:MAG: hypothetical protein QF449_13110 [Alphaproteobacteria bacterium]|jgi:hypothetical protein|nr:hypothetical protein [Alphaproteobacteria bacterium]MDP6818963.1 hypothetical protein [Alphaproteobacteria bacterium]|tara:strand:- start:142 stop:1296 length:1155 start_codon:yes stop_codon:yes gene_type:complete